ncbi:MAG TPA: ribonuclease J [Candidatus Sumerlaeota bacterium]|nr:ribonuclease J [Candidatus Sumerlaeota bacterium]
MSIPSSFHKDGGPAETQNTPSKTLRAYALGGGGEIGMNAYVLEYGDDLILIDCGQMTPDEDMPGVDLVIPDFSHLADGRLNVCGVFLTHGHEDHIGGLPYFLSILQAPIYGTPLTLGLVCVRLEEFELPQRPDLRELRSGEAIEAGPFRVVPFQVTHSVPGALGFIVETPLGTVMYSGDYKFDSSLSEDERYDEGVVRAYADQGILALFADSTNADRKGSAPREEEATLTLDRLFGEAPESLVVAAFASSLHRIQNILNLAARHNRLVFPTGLNMIRNIEMARAMGWLKVEESRLRDVREIAATRRDRRLLLSTGSQGEPLSVMSRMALDDFKWMSIEPDDTVILSSRIIPGNEKAILRMINHFSRRGARVFYEWTEKVHASGHAYREDMKKLIAMARPRHLIPLHGEYRHLQEHRALALEAGMRPENIFVVENGVIVEFSEQGGRLAGDVMTGRVLVDGKGVGDVCDVVLHDRRRLSADGMLIAILVINRSTGEILAGPDIVTRGFVFVDGSGEILEEARRVVLETFLAFDRESREDWGVVKLALQRALKKFIKNRMERMPMILSVVIEA